MKTNYFAIIIFIVFIGQNSDTFSQESSFKQYEKTYDVNKNSLFIISNKYGKVHIENIIEDKLIIIVNISTQNKSKEKADELLKKINVMFNQTGDIFSAMTEIESGLHFNNLKIDYLIKMPEYLKIDLTNKYGDIFINRLTSGSVINCSYGNMKINELITSELSNLATVNIKYSNGDINKCDYLNLDVKYSRMEINESRAVFINSGYSKIEFDKAYIIKAVSKYDPTFEINEVTKLELAGKFSDYNIGSIKTALKTSVNYSNIEVENILPGFEFIEIISKYGNVELNVDETASYFLNGQSEYGSISADLNTQKSENGLINKVRGFVGNNKESKSKIDFNLKYGNIEIE